MPIKESEFNSYNEEVTDLYRQGDWDINYVAMSNTLECCKSDEELVKAIDSSIAKEYVVYEGDAIALPILPIKPPKVSVTPHKTFEEARLHKGKRIAILNFANNRRIGGNPFYANAQEENLCRTSTLYPCLKAKEKEFYIPHREAYAKGLLDDMGNDDLIYTRDVVVFKDDGDIPLLLKEEDRYKVDVITIAAPILGHSYDEALYKKKMTSRIKRIFDVAACESVEVLILGAFGCGAFHNPPEVVANIFKELQKEYAIPEIVYAVYDRNPRPGSNYEVFKRILG